LEEADLTQTLEEKPFIEHVGLFFEQMGMQRMVGWKWAG
jgi:hypothetical protein